MNKILTIGTHTVEFRTSSCTTDPWTLEYYDKYKISAFSGQAFTDFLLLDNNLIYEIIRYYTDDEVNMLKTDKQLENWLSAKCKFMTTIEEIKETCLQIVNKRNVECHD